MSENHTCVRENDIVDIRKRLGKLEENDREDYGARKELAQAISNIGTTLLKVNDNLDNLNKKNEDTNQKIDNLEGRVNEKIDTLEEKFESDKSLNMIDLREVNKEKSKIKLSTVGLSIAGVVSLLTILFEIAKAVKVIK